MSQEPWKTDKWFVSPWNFNDAVRSELNFPKQIKIHDITLRDGEQQTGVILPKTIRSALPKALPKPVSTASKLVCPLCRPAIRPLLKRS